MAWRFEEKTQSLVFDGAVAPNVAIVTVIDTVSGEFVWVVREEEMLRSEVDGYAAVGDEALTLAKSLGLDPSSKSIYSAGDPTTIPSGVSLQRLVLGEIPDGFIQEVPAPPSRPVFVSDGNVKRKLIAVFGGVGMTEVYFDI